MTPLLSRIAAEKRWWLALLGIGLAVNVGLYAFLVRPLASSATGAGTRAVAAAEARRTAEREYAGVEADQAARQQALQDLAVFRDDVLPGSLAEARTTYASLPSLAADAGVAPLRRRSEVTPVGDAGGLQRLSVVMELQGTYQDLRSFIYELERGTDFVVIDDVTLTEQNETGPLGLVLTLSIYFASADNAG
ncbi:MAG: GspMb/PilO family protein [Vicinamibacterales bacterium]